MVPAELNAERIEIRVRGFDRRGFHAVEETHHGAGHDARIGHQVPSRRAIAGVTGVAQLRDHNRAETVLVNVARRVLRGGRCIADLLRRVNFQGGRFERRWHQKQSRLQVHHVSVRPGHVAKGFDRRIQARLGERGSGHEVGVVRRPEDAGSAGSQKDGPEKVVHLDCRADAQPFADRVERPKVVIDDVLPRE